VARGRLPGPARAAVLTLVLTGAGAGPGAAQAVVALPSGVEVQLIEVILDDDLELARFRLLAPAIAAPGFDLGGLRSDFDALCDRLALPFMAARRPDWHEVVISLSSEAIPFGQTDAGVVQAFQAYDITDGGCIWQRF